MAPMKQEPWYEMPSYTYAAEPGIDLAECYDCGPYWRCALELDPEAPYGLAIREWHNTACPVVLAPVQE
jgi:hypothetical protein